MSYFNDGLKAGQAMRLHESKLLLKDNAGFLTADASTNPARRTVYYLHTLWKKTHYGPEYSSDPLCKLREKIEGYASRGKIYMKKGQNMSISKHSYFIFLNF